MTHHSTAFEIERPVPADDAVTELLPASPETTLANPPAPAARQKFNFRKLLMTGAAVAALAGAAWYGWDYWTVGQYLVSTDDAYVKADNTTIAPKVSGYLHRGSGRRQRARQVRARCWRGSTTATSRSRSTRPRPTSRPRRPRSSASRPSSRFSRR